MIALGLGIATVAFAGRYAFRIWKPLEEAITEAAKRVSTSDWILGRPRNSYTPVPEKSDKSSRVTSSSTVPKNPIPVRSRQQQYLYVILLLGFVGRGQADAGHYPRQSFRWVLRHLSSDKAIKETITPDSPSFEFKLKDIFPPQLGFPEIGDSSLYQTYWCPASNPGKSYCNYPGYGYCGYWGCETIVTSDRWQPQQPDKFLQVKYAPHGCREPKFGSDKLIYTPRDGRKHTCKSYAMTILQPTHMSWATGKVWSVFVRAFYDIWVNVQIIRLLPSVPQSIGPNQILTVSGPKKETTTSTNFTLNA
ncbi:dnaJ homolog subfamily C member 15 isoform X2 [Hirundo rustica]|nr:dnaJ homolog subfamily C member 15 isoform X2 [Hirundo rustica]